MSYKLGYIYGATIDGHDVIKYQVDGYAYIQHAKSVHAAKIILTKHFKKVKGL